jgi:hypothetical protein
VTFSGDSAGHLPGKKSEFLLALQNNSSAEIWHGRYLVQLLDRDGIAMEIAEDSFSIPPGLGPQITIPVVFASGLAGPYGLSLIVMPERGQSITTIWIGEQKYDAVNAGPWPGIGSHPWLWNLEQEGTEEAARELAWQFVRNSPTYAFDGIEGGLVLKETLYPEMEGSLQFVFAFESRHAGYGERSGQMLAEVITPHEAIITVENGEVAAAVLDGLWDMLAQAMK